MFAGRLLSSTVAQFEVTQPSITRGGTYRGHGAVCHLRVSVGSFDIFDAWDQCILGTLFSLRFLRGFVTYKSYNFHRFRALIPCRYLGTSGDF